MCRALSCSIRNLKRGFTQSKANAPSTAASIESRLQLVAILFEFFAGRLELAAARRILMAEAASFAGLLSIGWRGADWPRNSQGHRACDQYCGRRTANKDDGFFGMHLHIHVLHC